MPITRTFRNRFSSNDKVQQSKMESSIAVQSLTESTQENPAAEKSNEAPSSSKMNFWKKWLTGLFQ